LVGSRATTPLPLRSPERLPTTPDRFTNAPLSHPAVTILVLVALDSLRPLIRSTSQLLPHDTERRSDDVNDVVSAIRCSCGTRSSLQSVFVEPFSSIVIFISRPDLNFLRLPALLVSSCLHSISSSLLSLFCPFLFALRPRRPHPPPSPLRRTRKESGGKPRDPLLPAGVTALRKKCLQQYVRCNKLI
jgi:hypothetical protein